MKTRIASFVMTLAFVAATTAGAADLDFGDHSSSTLTSKAWGAMGEGKFDDALGYIAKCLELYEAQAKEMQASLTDYPSNQPKEETSKYWALNDVGTCLFIKGETLMKQGKPAEAKEAYSRLVNDFKYAQCWDTKGWFWKPAEAAKQKVIELEFDAE